MEKKKKLMNAIFREVHQLKRETYITAHMDTVMQIHRFCSDVYYLYLPPIQG